MSLDGRENIQSVKSALSVFTWTAYKPRPITFIGEE